MRSLQKSTDQQSKMQTSAYSQEMKEDATVYSCYLQITQSAIMKRMPKSTIMKKMPKSTIVKDATIYSCCKKCHKMQQATDARKIYTTAMKDNRREK